jgi:hypothetical protein
MFQNPTSSHQSQVNDNKHRDIEELLEDKSKEIEDLIEEIRELRVENQKYR